LLLPPLPKSTCGGIHINRRRRSWHFRWLTGEDKLSSFESSPGKVRHFCSIRGSHLVAERAVQGHVILRFATLDDDPGQTPELTIWRSHEVPWLDYGPKVPGYAELPPATS
jgi:ADP-ribosyl-[dinitrogen reductase] hydrolase